MLSAYREHPDAFTSTETERARLPLSWWVSRVQGGEPPADLLIGSFDQQSLTGCVGVSFNRREKIVHKCLLYGMYVRPAHRGQGIGSALIRAVVDRTRQIADLRVMQLTVTQGNLAAEALYSRHGFTRFGVEPVAVKVANDFVAKVHMWCDLSTVEVATT